MLNIWLLEQKEVSELWEHASLSRILVCHLRLRLPILFANHRQITFLLAGTILREAQPQKYRPKGILVLLNQLKQIHFQCVLPYLFFCLLLSGYTVVTLLYCCIFDVTKYRNWQSKNEQEIQVLWPKHSHYCPHNPPKQCHGACIINTQDQIHICTKDFHRVLFGWLFFVLLGFFVCFFSNCFSKTWSSYFSPDTFEKEKGWTRLLK